MKTHKLTRTKIYRTWVGMKTRCYNKNESSYKHYGGRGIKVCERWMKFENFYEDMNDGCLPGMSIDRINVNGDYCPENCKWSNNIEQCNNRTNNRMIEFNGEIKTLSEWSRIVGIPMKVLHARMSSTNSSTKKALTRPLSKKYDNNLLFNGKISTVRELSAKHNIDLSTLRARLFKLGWSIEKSLSTPPTTKRIIIEYNGKKQNLSQWSIEKGINRETLDKRIKVGWSIEKALTTPVR